jgi:hypothetical protein
MSTVMCLTSSRSTVSNFIRDNNRPHDENENSCTRQQTRQRAAMRQNNNVLNLPDSDRRRRRPENQLANQLQDPQVPQVDLNPVHRLQKPTHMIARQHLDHRTVDVSHKLERISIKYLTFITDFANL